MIKVHDKEFEVYIPQQQIKDRVGELASGMNNELQGLNPVFLAVLNGSFLFMADLIREMNFPCEVSFIKIASYAGLSSSGRTTTLLGLDIDLKNRHVVIVEDIVDTGRTMYSLLDHLRQMGPASIRVATLILKPGALQFKVPLDYVGFETPDDFLIGYGLDYDRHGRHYKDIYKIKS